MKKYITLALLFSLGFVGSVVKADEDSESSEAAVEVSENAAPKVEGWRACLSPTKVKEFVWDGQSKLTRGAELTALVVGAGVVAYQVFPGFQEFVDETLGWEKKKSSPRNFRYQPSA